YFSIIDLYSAYFQMKLKASDRHKAAMISPDGIMIQPIYCPFGIKTLPSHFTQLMQIVLRNWLHGATICYTKSTTATTSDTTEWTGTFESNGVQEEITIINYSDDTLLASKTVRGMLSLIDLVLTRFEEVGLTIKVTKSEFMCQKVQMLGHIVTPDSIAPTPDKIRAIKELPTIKTLKQLRS